MSLKLGCRLKELRFHLCQTGNASKGVSRAFIEKHYVNIKKCNPAFPILIRECAGVKPALWARFENGNENCISLSELSAEDVLKKVEGLARQ